MYLGYNTNGFPHHDLVEAIEVLAAIGYRGVALTIDHGILDPREGIPHAGIRKVRRALESFGMRNVIETGARFLLDPFRKHEPTLMSPEDAGRARRVELLKEAIDIGTELSSDCVSLWSGIAHESLDAASGFDRLTDGLNVVLDHAEKRGIDVGFEPEPGMFIDRMDRFDRLRARLPHPRLRLTLDIGHLHCLQETPLAFQIEKYASQLVNVHLEDMRVGVHEHLMFGEGEIDFPPVISSLARVGYRGGVHVELSRHGHMAPEAARRSFEFLAPLATIATK